MKYTLLISLLVFNILNAQNHVEKCATTHYIDFLNNQYPDFKNQVNETFNIVKAHSIQNNSHKGTNSIPDTIYRIPVVFHVVYNTAAENIHDSLLQNQIDVLNNDYRRLSADTSNTRSIFKSRAADVGIEFFLATIDPNGNPTNGIVRTQTTVQSFNTGFLDLNEMDNAKKTANGGSNAWNTSEYFNIWVCNLSSAFLGDGLLGYAYPPTIANNWPAGSTPQDSSVWGLNIHYKVIGKNNPNATGAIANANQGRTVIHETGHFLGLRHIWGDSGNAFTGAPDCDITQDDGFSDTPHMGNNSQQAGCSFTKNTCTNGENPDEPDMVENYMDYSTEACQNMFTQEQANFMRSMVKIGRPNIAQIIQNDTINLSSGVWVVVNDDTVNVTSSTSIALSAGDSVMFLNENNGVFYTAEEDMSLNGDEDVYLTENETIAKDQNATAINQLAINKIKVYPNPTKNIVHFENLTTLNIKTIKLIDLNGKVLKSINLVENQNEINVDVTEIINGIYFINFENEFQKIGVKKLNIIK